MNFNYYFQENEDFKRLSVIKNTAKDYFIPKLRRFDEDNFLKKILTELKSLATLSEIHIRFISTRYAGFTDVSDEDHIRSIL